MKIKTLVLGGSGNLGSSLKKNNFFKNQFFPSSRAVNILKKKDIIKYIHKHEIDMIINCAALARMKE
jgi:dTDP-4-dehydrorhamnose reductase